MTTSTNSRGPKGRLGGALGMVEGASGLRVVMGRFRRVQREGRTAKREKAWSLAGPSRVALLLALAHSIQRAIDGREIHDPAEAAKWLGLTRARLTQMLDLQLLAPSDSGSLLEDLGNDMTAERELSTVTRSASCDKQRVELSERSGTETEWSDHSDSDSQSCASARTHRPRCTAMVVDAARRHRLRVPGSFEAIG
jgi:hypothetical protein